MSLRSGYLLLLIQEFVSDWLYDILGIESGRRVVPATLIDATHGSQSNVNYNYKEPLYKDGGLMNLSHSSAMAEEFVDD